MLFGLICIVLVPYALCSSGTTTSCTNMAAIPCSPLGPSDKASTYSIRQVLTGLQCSEDLNGINECLVQGGNVAQFGSTTPCNNPTGTPFNATDFKNLCSNGNLPNAIVFDIYFNRGCDFEISFSSVSADSTQQGCDPATPFCFPTGNCPGTQACSLLDPVVNITVEVEGVRWTRPLVSTGSDIVQMPFEYVVLYRNAIYGGVTNGDAYCCTKDTPLSDYNKETMGCFDTCSATIDSLNLQCLFIDSDTGDSTSQHEYCCHNNKYPPLSPNFQATDPSQISCGKNDNTNNEIDAFSYGYSKSYTISEFIDKQYLQVNGTGPSSTWGAATPWDFIYRYVTNAQTTPSSSFQTPNPTVQMGSSPPVNQASVPEYQYYFPGISSFGGNILSSLINNPGSTAQTPILNVFEKFYTSMFNLNDCDITRPPQLVPNDESMPNGYWMPLWPTYYTSPTDYDLSSTTNMQYTLQCGFCGMNSNGCGGTRNNPLSSPNCSPTYTTSNTAYSGLDFSLADMTCSVDSTITDNQVTCSGKCFNGDSPSSSNACNNSPGPSTATCDTACCGNSCHSTSIPGQNRPGGFAQRFWLQGMAPQCYFLQIGDLDNAKPQFDIRVTIKQAYSSDASVMPQVSSVLLQNITVSNTAGGCGQFAAATTGSNYDMYVAVKPITNQGENTIADPLGSVNPGYIGVCTSNPWSPSACAWNSCQPPLGTDVQNCKVTENYVLPTYNVNPWLGQTNEFLPPDQEKGCMCCMPIQQPLQNDKYRMWFYMGIDDYNQYVYGTTNTGGNAEIPGCGAGGFQPSELWGVNDAKITPSWSYGNEIYLQAQMCSAWGYSDKCATSKYAYGSAEEANLPGGFAGMCRPPVTPFSIMADMAAYEAQVYYNSAEGTKMINACPATNGFVGLPPFYTPQSPNMWVFETVPNAGEAFTGTTQCYSDCSVAKQQGNTPPFPTHIGYLNGNPEQIGGNADPAGQSGATSSYGITLFLVIGSGFAKAGSLVPGLLNVVPGKDFTTPCVLTNPQSQERKGVPMGNVTFAAPVATRTQFSFPPNPITYVAGTLFTQVNITCCPEDPQTSGTCFAGSFEIPTSIDSYEVSFNIICDIPSGIAIDCDTDGLGSYAESGVSGKQTLFTLQTCNTQNKNNQAKCSNPTRLPSATSTPASSATTPPSGVPQVTPTPVPTPTQSYPTPLFTPTPIPTSVPETHTAAFWIGLSGTIVFLLILVCLFGCCVWHCCRSKSGSSTTPDAQQYSPVS